MSFTVAFVVLCAAAVAVAEGAAKKNGETEEGRAVLLVCVLSFCLFPWERECEWKLER
jgi:hypothetical protein